MTSSGQGNFFDDNDQNNLTEKNKINGYLRRIINGVGVVLGGSVISQVLGALSGIITTNALGATHYGIYVLATSWMGLLADYSRLGFGTVIVRFTASYKAEQKIDYVKGTFFYAIKIQLLISIILYISIMIWSEEFCNMILNNPNAVQYFRFFSPAIILTSLYGSFVTFLEGMQNQKYSVISSAVVGNLSNIIPLIGLLWLGYGIYAALSSSLIQDAAILLSAAFFAWKIFPQFSNPTINSKIEVKKIWSFALTTFIASLSYKYAFGLAVPFIGYYRSTTEVGLYAVAFNLQQLIFVPANAFATVFNPIIAELYVKGEAMEINRLYKTITKWILISCMPFVIVVLLYTRPILSLFGSAYTEASAVLVTLTIASIFVNLIGVSGHIINMIGKARVNMINSIVTALFTISMFALLIPSYGIIGAACAYAIGLLINNMIRTIYVFFTLEIHPFSSSLAKVFLSMIISLCIGMIIQKNVKNPDDMLWGISILIITLAIYIGMVLLYIDEDDKFIIHAIRKKIYKRALSNGH